MGTKNKKTLKSRREFLKAAGKLTVYTPPAMMVLADPSLVAMAQSAGTPAPSNTTNVYTSIQTSICAPQLSRYATPRAKGSC